MNQTHRNSAEQSAGHQWTALCEERNAPTSAERRRRLAKPPHIESAIATRKPRGREVRRSRRMEIRAEVHCHSEEGADLKRASRRGGRAQADRMQTLRSDSEGSRTRIDGGI